MLYKEFETSVLNANIDDVRSLTYFKNNCYKNTSKHFLNDKILVFKNASTTSSDTSCDLLKHASDKENSRQNLQFYGCDQRTAKQYTKNNYIIKHCF